jgi:hypothetical protein
MLILPRISVAARCLLRKLRLFEFHAKLLHRLLSLHYVVIFFTLCKKVCLCQCLGNISIFNEIHHLITLKWRSFPVLKYNSYNMELILPMVYTPELYTCIYLG